jgi:cytochrome c biogenesis protein CcdA
MVALPDHRARRPAHARSDAAPRAPADAERARARPLTVQLLILVVSIGLADSLNPATVGPALFLATTRRARLQVAGFAAGVFAVNFVGGALIALGPGQLLLALVPKVDATAKHVIEVVVGVVMVAAGALLVAQRERLRRRKMSPPKGRRRGGLALGAAIGAIELPTAFPYFAAIAAIVGSDAHLLGELVLLAAFNLAFLAPVLAIMAVLAVAGERADRMLTRLGRGLERHWPVIVGGLLIAAGLGAIGLGAARLR